MAVFHCMNKVFISMKQGKEIPEIYDHHPCLAEQITVNRQRELGYCAIVISVLSILEYLLSMPVNTVSVNIRSK